MPRCGDGHKATLTWTNPHRTHHGGIPPRNLIWGQRRGNLKIRLLLKTGSTSTLIIVRTVHFPKCPWRTGQLSVQDLEVSLQHYEKEQPPSAFPTDFTLLIPIHVAEELSGFNQPGYTKRQRRRLEGEEEEAQNPCFYCMGIAVRTKTVTAS